MKRIFFIATCLFIVTQNLFAQKYQRNEESQDNGGSIKGSFFTGGSISLSFFDGSFLAGASPVFGYSVTKWADLGIVANYTYTSYRDYPGFNDKLHQNLYGGGVFTRLFPVKFLFAQGQVEHNWIRSKYKYASGAPDYVASISGNSFLVGGGYTTGRDPNNKSVYGYLAVLFDVGGDANSPYKDANNRAIPIIRAGINVPLSFGNKEK